MRRMLTKPEVSTLCSDTVPRYARLPAPDISPVSRPPVMFSLTLAAPLTETSALVTEISSRSALPAPLNSSDNASKRLVVARISEAPEEAIDRRSPSKPENETCEAPDNAIDSRRRHRDRRLGTVVVAAKAAEPPFAVYIELRAVAVLLDAQVIDELRRRVDSDAPRVAALERVICH